MKTRVLIAAFIFMVAIIMSCNEGEDTSCNIIGGILMVFSGLYVVTHLKELDREDEKKRR